MVEQIFLSPQVKQSVTISNKLGCTSCLTNDLRLRNLRILRNMRKISQLHRIIVSISKNFLKKQKLNFSRSGLFHMKTRVCLKYSENDCEL